MWSRSLNEEFGFLTTYGGRLTTPALFEDLVIASGVIIGWGDSARPTHRLLAFNKNIGELVWIHGTHPLPEDTTYSSPVSTVLDGQAALIFGSGDGAVHALQPRTGNEIWQFALSPRGLNVSPSIDGDRVYTAQGEENLGSTTMGCIVAIDGARKGDITKSGELWRNEGTIGKSAPVFIDGRLYAFEDSAKLLIIDTATGELIGRPVRLIGTILRQPAVCRRKDLHRQHQRLARHRADKDWRPGDTKDAIVAGGRSLRIDDRFARQDLSADRFGDLLLGPTRREAVGHAAPRAAARSARR